ncbi:hypothetical protein Pdw03_2206 [Penicillium digitatum]|jgi:hypothetical protein|uniref:SnoaL-like domain-containing protein n=3 Tax=Penicillium digitatum TaxID=36651 RepID=K9GT21_PEND2|nr:hypothetical protein PDIP_23410 [Penicillium digitatum Pd1]EKV16241.1 hypothetical protein PDIG_21130 [Penicillium digitatum PHI26]EKV19453.1 hypothetical protein PDIP_23410 [Penicillium digitatum Pd1]KAG0153487.1 hypothetical protein PDIDSM_2139 [Penicillium digitatum]QQK47308.1 hypothetical protein Pdw03_2206 [Penicillium digitatum]
MAAATLPVSPTPALSDRDAVADALYRGVVAFDTADDVLFKSALTDDAVLVLNGTVMEGYDAIYSQCYANIAKMDTNHFLTNAYQHYRRIKGSGSMLCSFSTLSRWRGHEARLRLPACWWIVRGRVRKKCRRRTVEDEALDAEDYLGTR